MSDFFGSGAVVPGSTTQVIFNDAGAFGADAGMTYDKTTDTLAVGALTVGTGGNLSSAAANTLSVANATTAQTFRVYNTLNGGNDEWGTFDWSTTTNFLTIGTQKAGSGTVRSVELLSGAQIYINAAAGSAVNLQNAGTNSALVDANGLTVSSGKALKIGNAAVTGLTAGVLAALTDASIVITDSAGQAYRIPCII